MNVQTSSIKQQTRLFRALADPGRLRLLALLSLTGARACVCELSDALAEPEYTISRHLQALESVGLVASIRDGRWIYYRFTSPPGRTGRYLTTALAETRDAQLATDRRRFEARMALRRDGQCVVWKIERLPIRGRDGKIVGLLKEA